MGLLDCLIFTGIALLFLFLVQLLDDFRKWWRGEK